MFQFDISAMQRRLRRTINPFKVSGLASLALLLVILVLVVYSTRGRRSSSLAPSEQKWNGFPPSVLRPSVDLMNGTDVIWQIPNSPKAVLFLAHGCNGRAANFWDRSPECPKCVGLPEERLIVLNALRRGFAVLAVSSIGRCWSFGKEKEAVERIIKWWAEKHDLEKLPLTALGASSGGYFVSALAAEMKFSSITIMIAEGVFGAKDIPSGYPPTLFVHMPKDRTRAELIGRNMEALRRRGVHVKEIKCMEFPLTPALLSDRIPGLDQTTSSKLFELFRERGFIDENGFLRNDGRATRWKQALRGKPILLEKHGLLDHIQEELNLAFGYHEMTSLQSNAILDWYEHHLD